MIKKVHFYCWCSHSCYPCIVNILVVVMNLFWCYFHLMVYCQSRLMNWTQVKRKEIRNFLFSLYFRAVLHATGVNNRKRRFKAHPSIIITRNTCKRLPICMSPDQKYSVELRFSTPCLSLPYFSPFNFFPFHHVPFSLSTFPSSRSLLLIFPRFLSVPPNRFSFRW